MTRFQTAANSKGVTLFLLWQEYVARVPDGYQYSRFCDLYRAWCGKLDVVMRQVHRAGEKLFVDYAGPTLPIVDPATGEIRGAQIFVAVLGASSYTYVEATWTQTLPDWLGAHVRALSFFDGCPAILGAGQPALRRHPGAPLRTRSESRVCGLGRSLRHRRDSGEGTQAAGQGQGRGRRAAGGALDSGAAAPSHAVFAGRGQRLHRRAAHGAQLGALRPGEGADRTARHRHHDRMPAPRAARRQPCALGTQGAPHHGGGAHAAGAPASGRLDARAPGALGREDGPVHRPGHHHDPRQPRPPGAGLSRGDGRAAPGYASITTC